MKTDICDVEQLVLNGVRLQGAGNNESAAAIYQRVLREAPTHAVALYSLAAICINQGQYEEGMSFAKRCLGAAPSSKLAWYIHGVSLKFLCRFDEALLNFEHALSLDPEFVDAIIEKAGIYCEGKNYSQSIAQLDKALAIDPVHGVALRNREALVSMCDGQDGSVSGSVLSGITLQNAGEIEAAREVFHQVLNHDGANFVAHYSLASMAINEGDADTGMYHGEKCRFSNPEAPHGWYILGCALKASRRFTEALAHFDRSLQLNPAYKEAMFEKGIVYGETKNYVQALVQFNSIVALEPTHKLALVNLATTLTIIKQHHEGSLFYGRLLEIDPEHDYALGAMTHARLHCCNWTDFEINRDRIVSAVKANKRACKPLAFLAISDSPEDQLICSQIFSKHTYPLRDEQFCSGETFDHEKIRIGYVSPDMREHPVGHLMAGVFEHHDRSAFEIYSFSLGIDDDSQLRQRFVNASDKFIDVRGKTSREIAKEIRGCEIDVLVDLAGPTMDAQPDIFAFRPAPIQVGYLGYPGTTGASYFDYIVADATVIPESDRRFYCEEVIHLPGCYLPTDSKLAISACTPTREEVGLPEGGFVFCSFNHDYKMNPDCFGVWMRILSRVENSVLWLMKLNDAAEGNLKMEAAKRGVNPARLIFATRVPSVADHLARYRLAGLFLDTFPYNAHSTATDALRAGLPVITLTGKSFQSRVATSVLRTVGMPQLAKATFHDYENYAVELAKSPGALVGVKEELKAKIRNSSLFDTAFAAKRLEVAYEAMISNR
jgi:protein O-GlcNAc transferase